jgi:hypothetical protein
MKDDFIHKVGASNRQARLSEDLRIDCQDCCPNCGYGPLDGAMGVGIVEPGVEMEKDVRVTPGSLTICGRCTEFLIFTDTLGVRNATEEEISELKNDSEFWHMLSALRDGLKSKNKVIGEGQQRFRGTNRLKGR